MKYEIHITVEVPNLSQFKEDCKNLGIKPIVIETEIDDREMASSKYDYQVMTSSKYDDDKYLSTLSLLTMKLNVLGYSILRQKIEIEPSKIKHEDFIYYESHLRLKLPHNHDRPYLKSIFSKYNFHMSRNLFKVDENFAYQMITYRTKLGTISEFRERIYDMCNHLDKLGFEYDKVEIEECIYDSNEKIDQYWLYGKTCQKHKKVIDKYTGSLDELVNDIGDLHYEALTEFLYKLSKKIDADANKDNEAGRVKLASALQYTGMSLFESALRMEKVWLISKPFM